MSLSAALSLAAAPQSAHACGGGGPSYTLQTDDQGGVPAGTKVLKVYVYYTESERPQSAILSMDGGGGGLPVTVPVTLRVKGDWLVEVDLGSSNVQAGAQYTLTLGRAGGLGSGPLRFQGVRAAPVPTELGRLTLQKREAGIIAFGACRDTQQGVHAVMALEPSEAAAPWVRAVSHQLYMDGAPLFVPELPLVNYVAQPQPTVVRAIAVCSRAAKPGGEGRFAAGVEVDVPAGQHSMQWRSTFPDGTVLETNSVDVDLRCDGAADAGSVTRADAGGDSAPDAGSAITDAGGALTATADAHAAAGHPLDNPPPDVPAADDGPAPDEGPAPDANQQPAGDGGCSLRAGPIASGPLALGILALLALLARLSNRPAVTARVNARPPRSR
ncbi:MAG TPA: hypothetical protein VFZ61_30975 [Polyangiales bacterium]